VRKKAAQQYLYLHLDSDGVPLYVGVTAKVKERTYEHLRSSPWRDRIDRVLYAPAGFDRKAAERLEREVILTLLPQHNRAVPVKAVTMAREEALALFGPDIPEQTPPSPATPVVLDPLDDLASLARERRWALAFFAEEEASGIAAALAAGYTRTEIAQALSVESV
jgi:hypothetical protein